MPKYLEWKRQLANFAKENKFPLTVECELTTGCNFRCAMCYVHDNQPYQDLPTSDWKSFFDGAIKSGALYFVLTGGEPLSIVGFWELYEYLMSKGVKITVFTNGSFINESVATRFKKNPPELITVTLYGYDEESTFNVTGVKNQYIKVDQGIDLLIKYNLSFILRTLPIKPIYSSLPQLIKYVQSKNQFLGYQLYIAPSKNQSSPSHLRLSPSELIKFEQMILNAFTEYKHKECSTSAISSSCQALVTGCFISHDGYMHPCSLADEPKAKLIPSQFLEIYQSLQIRWNEINKDNPCNNCHLAHECLQCPARKQFEGGLNKCSEYLKACAESHKGVYHGGL
jgi:MoaA/NifB/PqqE/SkfB family radical SAM enzyme